MPRNSTSLYGNAPEESSTVLLLIDMINDFDWPHGKAMLPQALAAAQALARLKKRTAAAGIPAIYVNDNFGRGRSDFMCQVKHCLAARQRGRDVASLLKPKKRDYFVLKPKHSGFYSSPLHILLEHIGAKTLIITGITTESCVLFTATEASLRGYRVIIPRDCVASFDAEAEAAALKVMAKSLKAKILASDDLPL